MKPQLRDRLAATAALVVGFALFGAGLCFRADLAIEWVIALAGGGAGLVMLGSRWLLVRAVERHGETLVPDWVALVAVLALGAVLYFVLNRE